MIRTPVAAQILGVSTGTDLSLVPVGTGLTTHVGELRIDGLVIACAVTPDGLAVVAQADVERALNLPCVADEQTDGWAFDASLPGFLSDPCLAPFLTRKLLAVANRPLRYQADPSAEAVMAFEAVLVPKVCRAWLKAKAAGALRKDLHPVARKAELLLRGFEPAGIAVLVDRATGYGAVRDTAALRQILDHHLPPDLATWARTLPEDFYRKLFRLRGLRYEPSRVRRPGFIGSDTNYIVYERLPADVLARLQSFAFTDANERRRARQIEFHDPQYAAPELKQHVLNVMFLMDAAGEDSWTRFQVMLNRAAPRVRNLAWKKDGIDNTM